MEERMILPISMAMINEEDEKESPTTPSRGGTPQNAASDDSVPLTVFDELLLYAVPRIH